MLNAVWVAVIVAAAFWVIGVCAAVYLMVRSVRLVSEATSAVSGLRERQEALIERAGATIEAASDQLARTDAITASMDEVTASMAELSGRVAGLAPLARMIAASAGSPLARVAAVAYGVNRAVSMRRTGGQASTTGATGTMTARVLTRGSLAERRRPARPVRHTRPAQPALTGQRDEAAP